MRTISWIRAALKDFRDFPSTVQDRMKFALEIASAGEMADIAKPMKAFDAGVFEISVGYRGDAFRTVYAIKLGTDVWVLHAFQKKSTVGIKTPRREIELVNERIRRIREAMR